MLAVAACNDRGRRSVYTDKGAAVFCSFPSNIRHSYIGDLVVNLLPPNSNEEYITLHNRSGGSRDELRRSYDALDVPNLDSLVGKSAQGRWTLEVRDEAREDVGRIVGFGLELVFDDLQVTAESPSSVCEDECWSLASLGAA